MNKENLLNEIKQNSKHNSGYWREVVAKKVLEQVYPKEFSNLVICDKPDLVDLSSFKGIEVTFPCNEENEKYSSFFYKYLFNKKIDEVSSSHLNYFQNGTYEVMFNPETKIINTYRMFLNNTVIISEIDLIFQSINKKLEKLNSNNYRFPDNCSLYLSMCRVTTDLILLDNMQKVLNYISSQKNKYTYMFKEVFVDCVFTLFRLNIENNSIQEIDITDIHDELY